MSQHNRVAADAAYGIRQLGEIVRNARRDAGASQRTLARVVGVNQSVISRLETGKLEGLKLRHLGAIIAVLDGRVEHFIRLRAEPAGRRLPRDPRDPRDPDQVGPA
jgi:transcriptional regulator with XRE-family HTH domain